MLNNITIVGRITRDPELRKTGSDKSVVSFTVAVNRRFNRDESDFINVVAWNQTADFLAKYGDKGALVGVEGRLQTRNYEDKDGKMIYVTEVVADNVQLLESKAKAEERRSQGGNTHQDEIKQEFENNEFKIDDDSLPF